MAQNCSTNIKRCMDIKESRHVCKDRMPSTP